MTCWQVCFIQKADGNTFQKWAWWDWILFSRFSTWFQSRTFRSFRFLRTSGPSLVYPLGGRSIRTDHDDEAHHARSASVQLSFQNNSCCSRFEHNAVCLISRLDGRKKTFFENRFFISQLLLKKLINFANNHDFEKKTKNVSAFRVF